MAANFTITILIQWAQQVTNATQLKAERCGPWAYV